jgi:type IV pilus assembly protein PilW
MSRKPQKNLSSGFTLIEILVALLITSILTVAIYSFFVGQHHAYTVQDQVIEMEQNARAAMDMIRRDLRMAGYHAMGDDLINNLSDFVNVSFIPTSPVTVNLDANPKISEGSGTDPDMITFLSVLPTTNNPTILKEKADIGDTYIIVDLTKSKGEDQYKVGDMLHLGTCSDYARIDNIEFVDLPLETYQYTKLSIDTNPTDSSTNSGLSRSYEAGVAVGEIYVVSYAVFNDDNDSSYDKHDPGHPVLKRKANGGGFQPVAENITDMQLQHLGSGEIEISLSSRTDRADHKFQSNDGYRSYTAKAKVKVRNADTLSVGTTCDLPSAPANVVIDGLNDTYPCQINITWDAVTTTPTECEVSGYTVYYGTTSGAYAYNVDVGNVTSYVLDVTAVNACGYYVAVSAVNSAGNSPKAAEQSITDIQAPVVPTGFNAENINGVERKVSLSWDMNTECDLQGYNVYARHDTATSSTKINSTVISNALTEYSDSSFTPIDCDTYHYSIDAVDFCPNSSGATTEVSVSPTAPEPPTGPNFSTSGTTDTISWILSADDFEINSMNYIVGYKVYDPSGTLLATLSSGIDTWTSASTNDYYDVSVIDECSNESPYLRISSVCSQVPVITFDNPAANATVSGTITINGVSSSTDRSITSIQLKIDNEDWVGIVNSSSFAFEWDTTQVANDVHTITVRATDSEGCYGETSIEVTVNNPETSKPQVFCTLYTCIEHVNSQQDSIYLLVYVYDHEGYPVSDASVEANILFGAANNSSKDIPATTTAGYYGGGDTAACTLTSNDPEIPPIGLAIKTKSTYTTIPEIRIEVTKEGFKKSTCIVTPTTD